MRTIQLLREKSRHPEFPLQVAGAALLTALGGPLVVVPALGYVAIDALTTLLTAGPSMLQGVVNQPMRMITGRRDAARALALEVRQRLDREAQEERAADEAASRRVKSDAEVGRAIAEVEQFYAENRETLAAALPAALFRIQLQTRFPNSIHVDRAWLVAGEMLSEMLPLIEAGRERANQLEAASRQRAADVRAKRRALRQLEGELEAWLLQHVDPDLRDLRETEVRSLREQIRELRSDVEQLEDDASGEPS